MSINNLFKTIKKLQDIVTDPNCKNMNPSNVKGYLGELLVAQKLISEGFEINLKGNQSGHDIEIPKIKVLIDVKFSTLKTEVRGCPNYWGWALKTKNKIRPISCTHFVCVAVDESLNPIKYFLIKSSDLNEFPTYGIGQFKNVEKGFILLKEQSDIVLVNKSTIKEGFLACKSLIQSRKAKELTSFVNAFK